MSSLLIYALIALAILYLVSSRFRYLVYMLWLHVAIVMSCNIALFPAILKPFNVGNNRTLFNIITWMTHRWSGITWEVRGDEIWETFDGPCVIVANHQSTLDVLGAGFVFPLRGVALLKSSLKYLGTFGMVTVLNGNLFVDRKDAKQSRGALNDAEKKIKEEEMLVWVFAEGTRNHKGGIMPFKMGAFHIAINCQIPIIPIVFSDYAPFYSKKEMRIEKGHVIAQVLDPISTEGLTRENVHTLADRTRETMLKAFDAVNPEVAEKCKRLQASA